MSNPFVFSAERRKESIIDHNSEPKTDSSRQRYKTKENTKTLKVKICTVSFRREDSNKRKSEILQKESETTVSEMSEQLLNVQLPTTDYESETVKEPVREEKERFRTRKKKTRPIQSPSREPECYYCKNLCGFHKKEMSGRAVPITDHTFDSTKRSVLETGKSSADAAVQAGRNKTALLTVNF